MNMRLPARLFLTLVVLSVFPACLPRALAVTEGSFQRTLTVSGAVDVDVSTGAGTITVRAGDEGSVRVLGRIRGSTVLSGSDETEKIRYLESHPPIEQNGNFIRIGYISDSELQRHLSISYELVVPAATRLRSRTGSGDQSFSGLRGPANISAGSGTLRISKSGGEVHAETGSGDIELNLIEGPVRASTGSGSVRATGIASDFRATTGSGDVILEQSAAGDVTVETGSGDVVVRSVGGALRVSTGSGDVTAKGGLGGSWKVSTASGDIAVTLPAEASFDLEAETSSGAIHTARNVTVRGTLGRKELRGKVGAGGHLVQLSTASGDIRIE
jgi:DUF4097 and DUF4098 domain-containing protein YvlB